MLYTFPGGSVVKNLPAMQETWVPSLGQEDPLEKGLATHSSIPAWEIPWTEEPDWLQKGCRRVGHNLATKQQQYTLYLYNNWHITCQLYSSFLKELRNRMRRRQWRRSLVGCKSMGSRSRLSDFAFTFHFPLSCIGGGNGNPLQCSCLENPRDGGAWWTAIFIMGSHRVGHDWSDLAAAGTEWKEIASLLKSQGSQKTTSQIFQWLIQQAFLEHLLHTRCCSQHFTFNKYLLSICCVPGAVLHAEVLEVNKTDPKKTPQKSSALMKLISYCGIHIINKEENVKVLKIDIGISAKGCTDCWMVKSLQFGWCRPKEWKIF